ncbi:hypothetical protein TNCV_2119251 [Trichonephila clavipes]|nr:hypothetical protein TNCV_2119251 [Trichonephila clavipes]
MGFTEINSEVFQRIMVAFRQSKSYFEAFRPTDRNSLTCVLVIFLTYLMVTNFFWMFVEGLYLYILAVKTFSIEVVRIQVYALIGWESDLRDSIPFKVVSFSIHALLHSLQLFLDNSSGTKFLEDSSGDSPFLPKAL